MHKRLNDIRIEGGKVLLGDDALLRHEADLLAELGHQEGRVEGIVREYNHIAHPGVRVDRQQQQAQLDLVGVGEAHGVVLALVLLEDLLELGASTVDPSINHIKLVHRRDGHCSHGQAHHHLRDAAIACLSTDHEKASIDKYYHRQQRANLESGAQRHVIRLQYDITHIHLNFAINSIFSYYSKHCTSSLLIPKSIQFQTGPSFGFSQGLEANFS